MAKLLVSLLVLMLGLLSCRTMPVAGECPESVNLRCMTLKVCVEDSRRGCQVCACESAWESDPGRQEDRQRGRLSE